MEEAVFLELHRPAGTEHAVNSIARNGRDLRAPLWTRYSSGISPVVYANIEATWWE